MIVPTDREPTPPGELLNEEFAKPLGLTPGALAARLGISRVAVSEIINGNRSITTDTAVHLGKAFGTTPEFWINGQVAAEPVPG
jgi:antitoxin HigA-1